MLDNARDARQVRPLIAGGPGSLVIVTGRAQLGGLVSGHGAHPIHLDVFADDDALALLERRLGARRVTDEPDAVGEIVEHCRAAPRPAGRAGVGRPRHRRAQRVLLVLSGAGRVHGPAVPAYSWHDLLRAYADEIGAGLDAPEERRAARERLFDHLVESTRNASTAIDPRRPRHSPPLPTEGIAAARPADPAAATDWTAGEHPVLVSAVAAAAAAGFGRHAWHLARELEIFQLRTGYWQEMTVVHRIALECARADGDLVRVGESHHSLAGAYDCLGEKEAAHAEAAEAVAAYRASGHRRGEAVSLATFGDAAERLGQLAESRVAYEESVALLRTLGDAYGLGNVANNLAVLLVRTGDLDEAEQFAREAMSVTRPDDQHGVGVASDTLGCVYLRLGRLDEAIPLLRTAAGLCEQIGIRYPLAEVLEHLGEAYAGAGDTAGARDAWQRADEILAGFAATPAGAELRERVRGRLSALVS